MKKNFLLICSLIAVFSVKAQVLLQQSFTSSSNVSTFIGTSPNQFDSIKVSHPNSSNKIYGGTSGITLQRYANSAIISKSTPLSATAPDFLKIRFTVSVPFNSTPTTVPQTQAAIYVGSSINADFSTAGETRYANIGIGFGTNTKFYFRALTVTNATILNSQDSLIGPQVITWFLNNSGATASYNDPNNTMQSLPDDTYDLWIGNNRVFTAIPVSNPTTTMNQFKILFNGSIGGGITFRDVEISTGTVALPVKFTAFTGKSVSDAVQLNWSTAEEINNSHFEILKSANGINFTSIGTVKGKNNSQSANDYQFTDNAAVAGTNYYQIKQVDNDGKFSLYTIIAVQHLAKGTSQMKLLASTTNEIKLSVNLLKSSNGLLRLTNVDGKTIYQATNNFKQGDNIISIPTNNAASKIYIAQFISADEKISLKIFRL